MGVLSSPCESLFGFGLGFSCIGVLLAEVVPGLDKDLAVSGCLLGQVEGELGPGWCFGYKGVNFIPVRRWVQACIGFLGV